MDTEKITNTVLELLIQLSKEKYPQQHICKLLVQDGVINEISIFSDLRKNIPEVKPFELSLVSALSYGPYLEKFLVYPDFVLETEFIGFAISHTDDSLVPTDEDKKLFSYKGKVHIITASPFEKGSWAAYDSNGNEIEIEVID